MSGDLPVCTRRRALLAAGALACGRPFAAWAGASPPPALDPLDPLQQKAPRHASGTQAVLMAAARAGRRIVVAGERGLVLLSDDAGLHWTQAEVPVSVTLTALQFVDERRGWAAGHSGIVLATDDGGRRWRRVLDGFELARLPAEPVAGNEESPLPSPGDPLLDLCFTDAEHGWVVGAFGTVLRTADGGRRWSPQQARVPNPDGLHLYSVRASGRRVCVAGERGGLFLSVDAGERFEAVRSPYEGSFFGQLLLADGSWLVYGLRGHAFRSEDQGRQWQPVVTGATASFTGALQCPDGRIVLVSQAGEVFVGDAAARRFTALPRRQPPLHAVAIASDTSLLTVGLAGLALLPLASPAARS